MRLTLTAGELRTIPHWGVDDQNANWKSLPIGAHRLPCPVCGRGSRDRAFSVTIEPGRGVGHCFRCGHVESFSDAQARVGASPYAKCPPLLKSAVRERLSDWGDRLWQECQPLDGLALDYLRARCCVIPPADGDLRWHPRLRHPTGVAGPAIVALVTDARTAEPLSLHRTWIGAGGEKAALEPARALLGSHRKAGGVIRLWPDDAVTTGLGIAEGVETALSLAHAYRPVWSAIDAGNLAAFDVLAGIECLLISVDHDKAGQAAAKVCAQRWADAGRSAALVMPKQSGWDINDLARAPA